MIKSSQQRRKPKKVVKEGNQAWPSTLPARAASTEMQELDWREVGATATDPNVNIANLKWPSQGTSGERGEGVCLNEKLVHTHSTLLKGVVCLQWRSNNFIRIIIFLCAKSKEKCCFYLKKSMWITLESKHLAIWLFLGRTRDQRLKRLTLCLPHSFT